MVSPDGIVPDELMDPAKKDAVVAWLINQPWPEYRKLAVLQGWAHVTGNYPPQADFDAVRFSATVKP